MSAKAEVKHVIPGSYFRKNQKGTPNLSSNSMWNILVSRGLLLQIRLKESPLTITVWWKTAIQVKSSLHKRDHAFHATLQIVSQIIKIKITASGLLLNINCLLMLWDFLLWALFLPPGVKHSSYQMRSRHPFNLCYILASDQLFRTSAKKKLRFLSLWLHFLQSILQRQFLQCEEKEKKRVSVIL